MMLTLSAPTGKFTSASQDPGDQILGLGVSCSKTKSMLPSRCPPSPILTARGLAQVALEQHHNVTYSKAIKRIEFHKTSVRMSFSGTRNLMVVVGDGHHQHQYLGCLPQSKDTEDTQTWRQQSQLMM